MSITFDLDEYIQEITQIFKKQSNPDYAEQMKKYMKNKFEFFGIKAQPRRKATRKFMEKARRPGYDKLEIVIKRLWDLPEREYQYFGTEFLERYKKEYKEEIINLFEYMITHKSWWDTVDEISKKLVGNYFKLFPESKKGIIEKWVKSSNIWLQRSTLLFQLGYKENTDVKLLFDLVKELKDIDEFFIQKAIGWSLREYSKLEPELVKKFVEENKLSSLSRREALKIIEQNKYG